MRYHGLFILAAGCMLAPATLPAMAQPACNPQVSLQVQDASLQQTLALLAEEHGFELTFPPGLDRTVSLNDELSLDRLVEKLTRGTSTSLVYRELPGCEQPVLARVEVYPEGEEGGMLLPASHAEPLPVSGMQSGSGPLAVPTPQAVTEYIYIDNMEQYAEEVILRKRRPELERMTPEQQVEYRHAQKKVKKMLEPQLKAGTLKREKRTPSTGATAGAAGATGQ